MSGDFGTWRAGEKGAGEKKGGMPEGDGIVLILPEDVLHIPELTHKSHSSLGLCCGDLYRLFATADAGSDTSQFELCSRSARGVGLGL